MPEIRLFHVLDFRFADVVDILLISVLLYYVFLLFRGTRAVQMVVGLVLVFVSWVLAQWFGLRGVVWLFSNVATLGILALVVVFQPEIRGALMRVGQAVGRFDWRMAFFRPDELEAIAKVIVDASVQMANKQQGALIVLEKYVGLRNYIESGTILNADLSKTLLDALFWNKAPLHDGAVIILRDKILAAGCQLPMPVGETDESLGMRHRAGKAITAETDALSIIVSEETGYISVAYRGNLRRKLNSKELTEEIKRHWQGFERKDKDAAEEEL
jgi:diadenylate cyclase